MEGELILCIPGPWPNRTDFIARLAAHEPKGRYITAATMLADAKERDFVPMDFREYEGNLSQAFFRASKGKVSQEDIDRLTINKNCVFLHFPADCEAQKGRIAKYTAIIRDLGGYAIKVEPYGPAHGWEAWFNALPPQSIFYRYGLFVTTARDDDFHFSTGMRYFALPDVEVSVNVDCNEATELMEQFNFWRISTHPAVEEGLTYSVTSESPFYSIEAQPDHRYEPGDPFRNPLGLWRLIKK